MSIEQIIVLAVIQGITEFLPISSSGHLILIPYFTGWCDQGVVVDVMVHIGSLFAVLVYFWRDVLGLAGGTFDLMRGRMTTYGRLALLILLATLPAVAFGIFLKSTGLYDSIRANGLHFVAWNAIIYAVLMYLADVYGRQDKQMTDMRFGSAMVVGVAQALAIIPGTSRSGATMTAARAMGFDRAEAARFSFLLGIPAITAAGLLTLPDLMESGVGAVTDAALAAVLTFFSALAAIAFLMALVKRIGLVPYVIYRLILGLVLLGFAYGGVDLGNAQCEVGAAGQQAATLSTVVDASASTAKG